MDDYPDVLRPGDHLNLAQDFYQAYLDLPLRDSMRSWPRYFLLCHAIELALKANLLHHGVKRTELTAKNVRHDLKELLARATSKGLSLSGGVRADNFAPSPQ